jgi:integrase
MARISSFLNQYAKSSTRSSYQSGVLSFLSYIYDIRRKGKSVSTEERAQYEDLADRYFIESRDHEQDLINFSNHCQDKYAPGTGTYYITAVKEFYIFNDVELTRKQERNLKNKIPRGGPISEEEDLTKEMVRGLLTACSLMLQTIIMIMLTSGMRVGEVITLTIRDVKIDPDGQCATILLKGKRRTGQGTKNVHSRTVFINKEAVELLNRWLKKRPEYLADIIGRGRGQFRSKATKDDPRIFPIGGSNAQKIIKTALIAAGLFRKDPDTGRSTIHYHLFRKYFVTRMTYGGVQEKYVEFFTGHLKDLDRAYNKPTVQTLLEIYLRGEPYLRIYDDAAEEIAKTKEEIRETKDQVRDVQIENLMTKSKLEELTRENAVIKKERDAQAEQIAAIKADLESRVILIEKRMEKADAKGK